MEAKPNEGLGSDDLAPSAGPEEIATAGATVSTVKDRQTIWLSFPGASIALTKKVWGPSESCGIVYGELQALKGSASKRQTKVEPGSFEANGKLGVGS